VDDSTIMINHETDMLEGANDARRPAEKAAGY
jgi:hypothetical protein